MKNNYISQNKKSENIRLFCIFTLISGLIEKNEILHFASGQSIAISYIK